MIHEEPTSPVHPLPSPWLDTLLDALSHVQHSLLMVSPYIKEQAVERILQALNTQPGERSIRIITRVNPDDLLSGASDIAALQRLLNLSEYLPDTNVEMRAIPNLHAKVWVCDRTLAIVGSGNATPSGLAGDGNLEYGLSVSDSSLIDRILSDWQTWWEQAQRVESPLLTNLASALQTIKASDDMRQLQARNDQLRQRLKALPRVGTPIRTRSKRQPTAHLLKEPPAPLSTPSEQAASEALSEQPRSQESISIPIPDFWQALRWVLPLNETASDLLAANVSSNANLKLIWQPVPAQHQALQLIWADGTRYSQASLPAHNATLKHPWAITLNMEKLRLLGTLFAKLRQDDFFAKQAQEHFHLFLKTSPYILLIAYPHNAAIELPCTVANIPGTFPTLCPPLSCTTIAHKDLQRALAELQRENPSTIIELTLTNSMLTLTTGQIEAPLTRSIAATDSQLAGPETRLRIEAAALQQIVESAPSHIETWRLCVDRYADAVQFNAQPAPVGDAAMVWRHEVRGG